MNIKGFNEKATHLCELILNSYKKGSYDKFITFKSDTEEEIANRILDAVCSAMLILSEITDELESEKENASFSDVLTSIPFSAYNSDTVMMVYHKEVIVSMGRMFEICRRNMPDIVMERELYLLSEKIFINGLTYSYKRNEDNDVVICAP